MASSGAGATWFKGRVKAVPSGDSLVIMAMTSKGPPPEKTITLSSLMAPRLARRGTVDEPFAWESREFLRKLCIGKEVTFKVDYTVASIGREFGTVFIGDKNVASLVVAEGWAKVKEPGQAKNEASSFLPELLQLEEKAKQLGLGKWTKTPGAAESAVRDLPPSAVGDSTHFDAPAFQMANKGKSLHGIVDQVRDGSTVRLYLLPDHQYVQVLVAGIKAPLVGRRATQDAVVEPVVSEEANGEASDPRGALTSAQRLAASASSSEGSVPFALEAKHFTEVRVLHRDVRIVLEGVDKFNNLVGSLYYPDGDSAKDLALELVENGLAEYVEWSANMLEDDAKKRLKAADLNAKKNRLKLWTNYVPPPSDSKAIHDQNFSGTVVEVVSGDCVIVADDTMPYGTPASERRVNLSSIKAPKMGNPRREIKPEPYAVEAKEFLRTRIVGKQVKVQMEYSRKLVPSDGVATGGDSRLMDFGTVFLSSPAKAEGDEANQTTGTNVAELVVARGFASVVRHRDFEQRSNYYDALVAAEGRAIKGKKGIHSVGKEPSKQSVAKKEAPVNHITDLTTASAKKAREFLPFLQRGRRISAVVEYVLSGHRFKLLVPKETCSIAFALSGVRCPGRDEPYSNEAIALLRRKIMQREVEIEVETIDRTGTFLGSLWESRTNVAVILLEAGFAKLQASFGMDRVPDAHLLEQAERAAKSQKLKVWENYVEGEEVSNGQAKEKKQKESMEVVVTEVLDGGRFYVQKGGDHTIAAIQQQLASLNLREPPLLGTFNPSRGDTVLAQFSADQSWNRAMIVTAPKGAVESVNGKYEVFYMDYGNQEEVTYSQLRPLDPAVSSCPGLAQLCSLAYIRVPSLDDDCGPEAAEFLSKSTLNSGNASFKAIIEDRDTSGGNVKGQGTGPILLVTLLAADSETSINAELVKDGLARIEKRKRWEPKEKMAALDALEKLQDAARAGRKGIWVYGDVQSDDEDSAPIGKKTGGRK